MRHPERKITVNVAISRGSHGRITLYITDSASRVEFCAVDFDPKTFAECVTGLYVTEVPATVLGLDRVGMIAQHRTEPVPFDRYADRKNARAALDAFETALNRVSDVPGATPWIGYLSDMENGHKMIEKGGQRFQMVAFHRHVPGGTP